MRTNVQKNERNNEEGKCRLAETEFKKLMENICCTGFFGSASVTVNVQDGHIQTTRVAVDRMIR